MRTKLGMCGEARTGPVVGSTSTNSELSLVSLTNRCRTGIVTLYTGRNVPGSGSRHVICYRRVLRENLVTKLRPRSVLFSPLYLIVGKVRSGRMRILRTVEVVARVKLLAAKKLSGMSGKYPGCMEPVLSDTFLTVTVTGKFDSTVTGPYSRRLVEAMGSYSVVEKTSLCTSSFLRLGRNSFTFGMWSVGVWLGGSGGKRV